MGYYVQIVNGRFRIPKANLQRAYEKMCALNVTHHDQKQCGSWSVGTKTQSWFSWMDPNYPETCKTAHEVLEALGFHCHYDDQGDLIVDGYDSKMGQEDLFMAAIKEEAEGSLVWRGEDGATWTTTFVGDTVIDAENSRYLLEHRLALR